MAPPDFAVARPHLDRRLDGSSTRRLTLVAAPAGYGKSVLLSQWYAARPPGAVVWLTLDERDRDPTRLGAHLLEGFAAIDPALGRRAAAVLGAPGPGLGDEVVDLLLDDLAALTSELTVVFEDLDHLEGSPVLDDLSRLVLEAPDTVHLVVAARRDPALPTHRLRAQGQLLEVRAEHLRFSPDEAAALVAQLGGHRLNADAAEQLTLLTEGWPVAVQLAALSLRDEPGAALARFSAADRGVVDYLSAEVLAGLRPELRSFLRDTAVLDELLPELCDAVAERTDSATVLSELRAGALFVVPTAGDSTGYRMHRLVRDFLRHDLTVEDPARMPALRRRAARWYLERDDPGQAAEYLLAAHAWDDLTLLIHSHGRRLWDSGHIETVLAWIEAIPVPVRASHLRLRLTEAALLLLAGRPEASAALLASIERDGSLTLAERTVVDLLVCGLVEIANPDGQLLGRADRALAALEQLDPADLPDVLQATDAANTRCLLHFESAKARLLLGAPGALDHAAAATEAAVPSTSIIYQVHASGTLALVAALAHQPDTATLARRAATLASKHLGEDHPGAVPAQLPLIVLARDRGDLDDAAERCDVALANALRWRRWPSAALVISERALVELARGEPAAAIEWIERFPELTAAVPAPMVAERFDAIRRRAAHALDEPARPGIRAGEPTGWELGLTAVSLAVAGDDPTAARKALDDWRSGLAPLGELEHELAGALVDHVEGDDASARTRIDGVLATTESEQIVGPFVAAGSPILDLLDTPASGRRGAHVERITTAIRRSAGWVDPLVDPLSDREIEVLRLLPTRLSNAELADALYVSTNTVKTHLKHIYQKLDAQDRDDAVRRARELRLL